MQVSFVDRIFRRGSKAIGKRAVIASGVSENIQKNAIKRRTYKHLTVYKKKFSK